jgi:hypothetical protein
MSQKKRTCKVCGRKMRSTKRLFDNHESKCAKNFVGNVLVWLRKDTLRK